MRASNDAASKSTFVVTTSIETEDDVIQHFKSGVIAGLASIPGTVMNHVLTAKPSIFIRHENDFLPKVHGNCAEKQCHLCNAVFDKYVKCEGQRRGELARATRDQNSSLWRDQQKSG